MQIARPHAESLCKAVFPMARRQHRKPDTVPSLDRLPLGVTRDQAESDRRLLERAKAEMGR